MQNQRSNDSLEELIRTLKNNSGRSLKGAHNVTLLAYLHSVRFFKEKYDEVCEFLNKKGMDPPHQDEFLQEIADGLKYEYFEPERLVFHHKAIGDRLFIILKGTVNIYVPKGLDELSENKSQVNAIIGQSPTLSLRNLHRTSEQEKIRAIFKENQVLTEVNLILLENWHLFRQMAAPHDLLLLTIGQLDNYYEDGVFKYKLLSICGEGDNFGEIAMQQNVPRSATVVSREALHVVTLNREVFKKVFSSALHHDKEKEDFFENLFPGIQRATRTKVKGSRLAFDVLVAVFLWFQQEKVLFKPVAFLTRRATEPNIPHQKRRSRSKPSSKSDDNQSSNRANRHLHWRE